MWPRLISRGKKERLWDFAKRIPASMWPRLISRGKRSSRVNGAFRPTCFNVAAADQPRKVFRFQ